MIKRTVALLSVSLAVLFAAAAARAQDPTVPMAVEATPELTPVTLVTGRTEIRVPFVLNMSSGFVAKPLNIPLDIYHGLTDDITIGISHSGGVVPATAPFPLYAGLCLAGTSGGCGKFYNNLALDGIFRFMGGVIQLAGHGGLDFHTFDPMYFALRLGVIFQAPLASHVAIIADPRLWIGVTKRDLGNKEVLSLPVAIQYWATEAVKIAVRTQFWGPLDGFSDAFRGSLGLYLAFGLNEMIEPFLAFDFLNLYGKNGSADFRSLLLGATIRL